MPPVPAYRRLRFHLDPASEELLSAKLWELGTLGVESRDAADGSLLVEAWFPAEGDAVELRDRTADWRRLGIELVADDELPDRDWLAEYRRLVRPFALGARFWADPRDPADEAAPVGRVRLRLPARRAFGTGSHATTQLAVELLEERPPAGLSLLDVGAGTGVLSLVALHLGAGRVVALENDSAAALQAAQIAALNGMSLRLLCASPAALGTVSFDRIAVNMTLASLSPVLPEVARLLAAGGEVVVSGALEDQAAQLRDRLRAVGLESQDPPRRREGWIALRATRRAA